MEKLDQRKWGPEAVLDEKEDVAMIAWTLTMGECGLSISLQQPKTKVAKLTQIRATPFQNGIPNNIWWY
jgi:hypothetical protein